MQCSGLKKDGERCKAWAVRGEQLCAGHLGRGVAAGGDVARAAQKQGAERRSEQLREARKGPQDVYRDMLTRRAEVYAARLDRIIEHGSDADSIRALDMLNSRVYGKPKETVETVEIPKDLHDLESLSLDELNALWARVKHELEPPAA